jgi:hypothetical protein
MISNFVIEHAISSKNDPLLQALFQYIDQLFFPNKKALLDILSPWKKKEKILSNSD